MGLARTSLKEAVEAGRLLTDQKAIEKAAGRKWLDWLKANVKFSHKTASNYIHLWEGRAEFDAGFI